MPALTGPSGGELVPLERRVLSLWRLRGALVLLAVVATVVAAGVASGAWAAGALAGVVLAAVGGMLVRVWTGSVWRAWQFRIGEHALHLRHGVVTRRESTIPFHRVQHIDLEAGPLERRFGLTSLILRTASASSDATVPGIDAGEADALRARILELVGTGDAL
ncbi:MAG TPA: PH domain-containing protein [Acidimicrobiales bacterium]|nr:PH domain-containing protein [Acidimicrobiales bacterium]